MDSSRKALRELWRRDHTGNAIGNFHILSASDNRGQGKASFIEKTKALATDGWTYENSAVPTNNQKLWERTSAVNKYCWTDDRVMAFQEAVDLRFQHLYCLYFNAIKVIIEEPISKA